MIPDDDTIVALHKKFAQFAKAPHLDGAVLEHCRIVSEIALWCADNVTEPVDRELLRAAALLHDVGSYPFFNEQGQADGQGFYPLHGILGAKIVLDEGYDPRIAQMIETHLLMGFSKSEIADTSVRHWALPMHDYQPKSLEAEILCYADRFHSKTPQFNSFETLRTRLRKMPEQAAKFVAAGERFGIPDIGGLAAKYHHPVQ